MKCFNFFRPDLDMDIYNNLTTLVFTLSIVETKEFMNKKGYNWNEELHEAFSDLLEEQFKLDTGYYDDPTHVSNLIVEEG